MSALTTDKGEFLGLWFQTLLYGPSFISLQSFRHTTESKKKGVYLVYFCSSNALMTWKRTTLRINWILVTVSLVIFSLATAVRLSLTGSSH